MSSINDIINQYLGSRVDGDGYPVGAEYQCTDWVARFIKETTGLNTTGMRISGGAKDIFQDWPNSFVRREWNTQAIANSVNNFPQPGDIVAWNGNMGGGFGHTAVCESANVNSFTVIEQNGGIGRGNGQGTDAIRRFTYPNYNNVLGWVRFPQITNSSSNNNRNGFAIGPVANDRKLKSFEEARNEVLSKFGKSENGYEPNTSGIDRQDLEALLDNNRDLNYVFNMLKSARDDFNNFKTYILNILLDGSKGNGWKDQNLGGRYDILHRLTSSNDYGGVVDIAIQGINLQSEVGELRTKLSQANDQIKTLTSDLQKARLKGPIGNTTFGIASANTTSQTTFSEMGATTTSNVNPVPLPTYQIPTSQYQQFVIPNSSNKAFWKSKKWWVNFLNLGVGVIITVIQTSGIQSGDDGQSILAKLITAAASIIGLSVASSVYISGQSKVDAENIKLQGEILHQVEVPTDPSSY